jgi:hypothetical protein
MAFGLARVFAGEDANAATLQRIVPELCLKMSVVAIWAILSIPAINNLRISTTGWGSTPSRHHP